MARSRRGTKRGLAILTSVALVWGLVSSPIRAPQSPSGRVAPSVTTPALGLAPDGQGVALTPATPVGVSNDGDCSRFIEGGENEPVCTAAPFLYLAVLASDCSSGVLAGFSTGRPLSRIVSVPLRC